MKKFVKSCYAYIIVLFFWYILYISVNSPIIPSPTNTIVNFFKIFTDKLFMNIIYSTYRIIISLGIALVLGTSIGVLSASINRLDDFISPIVYLLYPVPKIAFLPVLMVFFGLGDLPKIILIIIIIIFQFILSVRDAVKKIPIELVMFEK
ncbi:MAG: ABC transporter permease subunit, partial [Oscillospiraceae bacterium]|nr:ABC transporter permease subunit [Oscillospiraceae bacterium]